MNKIINGVASEYDIPMIYKNKTTTNSLENEEVFTRWQDATIEKLRQEKDQLQNNWNELKKFVEERIKFIQEEKAEFEEDLYNDYETNKAEITIRRCNLSQLEDTLEKMQELEGENNNEEESNSK